MLAHLPPLCASALWWGRRLREQHRGGWERLVGRPVQECQAAAEKLMALGVPPLPSRPVPVPAWMERLTLSELSPALAADSILWSEVPVAEKQPFVEHARKAHERAQQWVPWAWVWAHHPQGQAVWSEQLMSAWLCGDAALAKVLLAVFPHSVWRQEVESHNLWPWSALWRRAVLPAAASTDGTTPMGDWRHTLGLWEQLVPHLPSPQDALHAITTWPALSVDQVFYMGTNPNHYQWHAPQLEAWLRLGLPFPRADDALWWMGLDWTFSNPWGEWLSKGFDPVVDRTATEERVWESLQLMERVGLSISPAMRQRLMLAWLADLRSHIDQAQGLDAPERVACEARWAQWLSSPFPPAPDEHGWAHAVACAKGAHGLRCRSLKKICWSALPLTVFTQLKDGLLPWEAFREAHRLWPEPEHLDTQEWLRRKASEDALDQGLPAAVAPEQRRSRF